MLRSRAVVGFALGIAAAAGACASPRRPSSAALLGVQDVDLPSTEIPFTTGALKPYAERGAIVGTVTNRSGEPWDGLEIHLVALEPPGSAAPRIAEGRLLGVGGFSRELRIDSRQPSRGYAGNLRGLGVGHGLDVRLVLEAPEGPECREFAVRFTPLRLVWRAAPPP